MLNAALELASAGWDVLPLRGKVPTTPNGFLDASRDPETVTAWWTARPNANVGLAIPAHLLVLDVDPRSGGDRTLDRLEREHHPLPDTLTARSGRGDGGLHLWFHRPLGELTGRLLRPGIDLKIGGRGYVVAPPSIHHDSGRPYEWVNEHPVALAPAWLVRLIRRPPALSIPSCPTGSTHNAALVRFVAGLTEGERNSGLFWAACRAAEAGALDDLEPELAAAALGIGLTEAEVRTVLGSARRGAR